MNNACITHIGKLYKLVKTKIEVLEYFLFFNFLRYSLYIAFTAGSLSD